MQKILGANKIYFKNDENSECKIKIQHELHTIFKKFRNNDPLIKDDNNASYFFERNQLNICVPIIL